MRLLFGCVHDYNASALRHDHSCHRLLAIEEEKASNIDESKLSKQELKKLRSKEKKDSKEAKKTAKSQQLSKTEQLKAANTSRIEKKSHAVDMEKMTSNVTLDQVFQAKVDTDSGRLKRMLKMVSVLFSSLTSRRRRRRRQLTRT